MPSILEAPHFQNEDAAYAKPESLLRPNGPVCAHHKGTERFGNALRAIVGKRLTYHGTDRTPA